MLKPAIAIDRMSDQQLWHRLASNLLDIENHWTGCLTERQISGIAKESLLIARELRTRGTQLKLIG